MSNAMVVLVLVVGFAALAGIFLYLTILDAGRWRKCLDATLLPIGFVPVEKIDRAPLEKRLLIAHPRHGGKRLLMHLYRRPSPDGHYQLYVCDYRFSSASGKGGGASWMLVCLVSETLALPRLHIEGLPDAPGWARSLHYALANAMEIPGAVRVMTGRSEIDSRYQIYGFDGDAARHVPPGLLPILRDAPGNIGVDMGGDVLILSSVEMMADRMRQELDPQKIQGLIHRAVVMFGAITPQGLKSMLHV
jgi:hypothetical protein